MAIVFSRYLIVAAFCTAISASAETPTPWALQAVISHPRWISFVERLEASYINPVPTSFPSSVCGKAIEKLPASARSMDPVDFCIEMTLQKLDNGRSSYKPPEEFSESQAANKKYVGIGLEIAKDSAKDSPLRIVSTIYNAPGERGGLLAGDEVLEVDGVDFRPLTIKQTVDVMRGEVGTTMHLTVQRKGQSEPLRFAIKREEVRIAAVRAKLIDGGVVYARIGQFRSDVSDEWGRRLVHLLGPGNPRPTGLILDLRGNPGGMLDSVAPMASWFSKPGVVAVTVSRHTGSTTYSTEAPAAAGLTTTSLEDLHGWLSNTPIVVLVDATTSSAAEALAQFLRERRSAKIIGQQTAGSPYVYTTLFVNGESSVSLLSGRMYSPLGKSWSEGLVPDEVLKAQPGPYEWADARDVWLNDALASLRLVERPR